MQKNQPSILILLGRWAPLIGWLMLIFFLSNQQKGSIPSYGSWDLLVKKGAHFGAYGLVALLAWWAGFRPLSVLVLTLAYAISDELHQLQIPGRNGRPVDVLIDLAGAVTALALLLRLQVHAPRLGRWRRQSIQWGQKGEVGERLPPGA